MPLRKNPHLLEINAFLFLKRLSEKYGKRLTLASIPEEEWKAVKDRGFDAVWLMGVWKRSPGARALALKEPNLKKAYDALLPDWREADVAGSPYAVYAYELDPFLGTEKDLRQIKSILNSHGLSLILDYVPNHLAFDHPLTLSHPECFVEGTEKDSKSNPGMFFRTRNLRFLAHGRDPYFPSWNDTVQVNYFAPGARQTAAETLEKIAQVADGVRCDMAMLGIHRIFENVWKRFLHHARPQTEFWKEVIPKVRQNHPDFIFMAEAYWDLEWELQQMGFDFTYDKRMYDRLLEGRASEVRAHLRADLSYQEKSVRFIENHDEARVIPKFGREKSYAAAAVMATVPGLRFFYDGQMEGRRIHLPVQLGREPQELRDPEAEAFYKMLFAYSKQAPLHEGQWQMLSALPANPGEETHQNLLSWCWKKDQALRLVLVNYAPVPSRGRVKLPADGLPAEKVQLLDRWAGEVYERERRELVQDGLYVNLGRWKAHLFEIK